MSSRTVADMETPLTNTDRCLARGIEGVGDGRCGARARVRAHFEGGSLDFCGRHFLENEDAIRDAATVVQDESARIQEEEDRKEGIVKSRK
jgi:hypothetical protein